MFFTYKKHPLTISIKIKNRYAENFKFVEAHGGEIRAESKYGEGTCIIFTLPIT